MKLWARVAIISTVVVVFGGAGFTWRTMKMAGSFDDVVPVPLACKPITGVVGAEDMQIDNRSSALFVSAADRRHPGSNSDGIYALSLLLPDAGFVKLAGTPKDFHPHGISLFRSATGALTLMAVNHITPEHHAIDIFQVNFAGGQISLNEVGAIEGDKLIHPNDVVAVSESQFYVTNDHGSRTALGTTLENYLNLPRADVLYYDGVTFKDAATGLVFANGINVSRDGRHVYVAETTMRRVQTFSRDMFSGRLTSEGAFDLPSGPDNIDVDTFATLWIAGHPKLFDVLAYASDPSKPSPTEIFKVRTQYGQAPTVTPVYADLGHEIGAGSVAVTYGKDLYIGSIFDPKVLRCSLPD